MVASNNRSTLQLFSIWARSNKPGKYFKSTLIHLGAGSFKEVSFHQDRDKTVKQLSLTDRHTSNRGFCTQSYEKQQNGWQKSEQFSDTVSYKIPKGYVIVAVKIPQHADLLSIDSVPICNFVVMKDQAKSVPP